MPDQVGAYAPIARSPISPRSDGMLRDGWEVSGRRSAAPLRIADWTPMAKIGIRSEPDGGLATLLAVGPGRAIQDATGLLVAGLAPGEWLLLGPPGSAGTHVQRLTAVPDTGLVSIADLTHGLALVRITGEASPALLEKVCAIDLRDAVTPNGSAFRTRVAGVVAGVIRDDLSATRSYLLHADRAVGQHLFDALLDAGTEFGADIDGFPAARA